AAHRIMNDVPAGTDPIGAGVELDAGRNALARHEPAPRHNAGELRAVGAEHRKASARLDPVGTNDDGSGGGLAVFECDRDAASILGDVDALASEMDRIRALKPDRLEQRHVQVAAMEHHIGKAVALDRHRAEVEQLPGLTGAPEPDLLAGD